MPKAPFEELVKSINHAGLCCTQLALRFAVSDFGVERETMTPGMALYMNKIFQRENVDVAVLGSYFNLCTPDETELAETLKLYEAHIRFACHLGCGVVGTETGAVNKEYKPDPANQTEEALNLFIERLKPVVSYAEQMGVLIGIEPVSVHIMSDIKRTRKVLDAISSPNLRVILDMVNLLNIDNYKQQDEMIEEAFDLLSDEIAVLHLKDYIVEKNQIRTRPVTFGTGEMNFPLLMKYAKEKKPCIHCLIEDSIPENIQQSMAYLQQIY